MPSLIAVRGSPAADSKCDSMHPDSASTSRGGLALYLIECSFPGG